MLLDLAILQMGFALEDNCKREVVRENNVCMCAPIYLCGCAHIL